MILVYASLLIITVTSFVGYMHDCVTHCVRRPNTGMDGWCDTIGPFHLRGYRANGKGDVVWIIRCKDKIIWSTIVNLPIQEV